VVRKVLSSYRTPWCYGQLRHQLWKHQAGCLLSRRRASRCGYPLLPQLVISMDYFNYHDEQLYAEAVAVNSIAEQFGTPCYVYSKATLKRHYLAYESALANYPHLICYAVKANSNLAVLHLLAKLGSGFDIVSLGELERVLAAGGKPSKIVFSGVGKQPQEMARALEVGVHCFNVESAAELTKLEDVAKRLGRKAPVSLRVNPDVDAGTHPYISTGLNENKFGIPQDEALALYHQAYASQHLEVIGIDCHIGSQLTQMEPFLDALKRVLNLVRQLRQDGIPIEHLDLGGGLGVIYNDENPPHPSAYAKALLKEIRQSGLKLILEPGRSIAANAGILLTRVDYIKQNGDKCFAVVDGAMNDLLRPALYDAWQEIIPVSTAAQGKRVDYDVVGAVCESGDFLGKDRKLVLQPGDLLAVRSAGAYGFSMSSNYNTRPRAAEVMVDGDNAMLVRRRETIADLFAGEIIPTEFTRSAR